MHFIIHKAHLDRKKGRSNHKLQTKMTNAEINLLISYVYGVLLWFNKGSMEHVEVYLGMNLKDLEPK